MTNHQTSTRAKICISFLSIILFLLYFSTNNNGRNFRMKLVNSLHRKSQSSQSLADTPQDLRSLFNLTTYDFNLEHFELLELIPLEENYIGQSVKCLKVHKEKSLLLVNANTKLVGLKYFNLIKTLVSSTQRSSNLQLDCMDFRIFVLKQKRFLFFEHQSSISSYVNQLSRTIQQITKLTQKKFDILTAQEGSVLVLKSLLNLIKEGNWTKQIQTKINKIVLINLYNRVALMNKQPVGVYLEEVKQDIVGNQEAFNVFSELNLVMINTLKEQYRLMNKLYQIDYSISNMDEEENRLESQSQAQKVSQNFFVFQNTKQSQATNSSIIMDSQKNISDKVQVDKLNKIFEQTYLTLPNSHILHTKQMFNLHVDLSKGQYFTYQPFLEMLAQFIKEKHINEMSQKAVEYFFKYGERNVKFPFESLAKITPKQCISFKLQLQQPSLWSTNTDCFRITINTSFSDVSYLIYSDEGIFDIYSESLVKLQEYQKTLNKSVYLFQRVNHQLLIYNSNNVKVVVAVGKTFSPSSPLTDIFSEFQILYMGQVDQKALYEDQNTKKFVVKTCTNNLIIFPDNVPVGKYHRQFLLENSSASCYKETSTQFQFMQKLFDNQILLKNLVILLLVFGFAKNKPAGERIKVSFLGIWMLLYYTNLQTYHIIFIIFVAYLIEKGLHLLCLLSACIQIDRTKVFFCMLLMFFVAWVCEGFLFQQYDYWKLMLIFLIFFINQDNAVIIASKVYYLQEYIVHGEYNWIQVVYLMCYMKATQQNQGQRYKKFVYVDAITKNTLLICLTAGVVFYPNDFNFHNLITYYMITKIFCETLERFT